MIDLSYSLNGLTNVDIFNGISEIENAGFKGFEFSFQKKQFDPFTLEKHDLLKIKDFLKKRSVKPVCISTATTFFLSNIPHEPSVISLDEKERMKRLDLIKKGVDIAKTLEIPIVSFQSGYIRNEHLKTDKNKPRTLLINAIREIVEHIGNDDVTLVIEPEPGMFIEGLSDAVSLIDEISSSKFRLHMDIGHVYCTEKNFLESIVQNIKYTKYMHLADIKSGDAVRFDLLQSVFEIPIDIDYSKHFYLYSLKDNFFVFLSDKGGWVFTSKNLKEEELRHLQKITSKINQISIKDLPVLDASDDIGTEIRAYLDSIGGVSFSLLEKAKPVIEFLRIRQGDNLNPIVERTICNTLKGKVHYHERLGYGEINLEECLKTIESSHFKGYVTVELYNHVDMWQLVLPESYSYVYNSLKKNNQKEKLIMKEWDEKLMGDTLDHRRVIPPYIRLISYNKGEKSDYVYLYDLRFVKPNCHSIPPATIHTLEHLLIKGFKKHLCDKYISLSPMGCQTGFYLSIFDIYQKKKITEIFKKVLLNALDEYIVPYQSFVQCGQAKLHDLKNAKVLIKKVLNSYHDINKII